MQSNLDVPSMSMNKRIMVALFGLIVLLGGILFTICHTGSLPSLEQNVEALVEGEDIVTITCLPEEDSVCVSLIEDVIRIDHYFSPH